MITATPNSVRWDHIDRVTYRFQALNFQSDVLEALVLNSPPLTRKSRRKPIIRIPPDRENSSQGKINFVKVRKVAKRSYSFDDGFVDRINNDVKQKQGPDSELGKSERLTNGCGVKNPDLRQHCLVSQLEHNSRANGLRFGFGRKEKLSAVNTNDESTSRSDLKQNCYQIGNEEDTIHYNRENLKDKSKDCLIQLVLDLQNRLTNEKENHKLKETEVEENNPSNICTCGRFVEPSSLEAKEEIEDDSVMNDTILAQMKQLETEVQRTRKIASMFENELTCLKDKVSDILIKSHNMRQVTTANVDEAVVIQKEVGNLRTEKTCEIVNTDMLKQTETSNVAQNRTEPKKLSKSETNSLYLDKTNNLINYDVVSVLG